jgi:hypothetical protein
MSDVRKWEMPPVPPGVTVVRDMEGYVWRKVGRSKRNFMCEGELIDWPELLYNYGPLTEVSEDGNK